MPDNDRTASLMTPSKLAQVRAKPPAAQAAPGAWLNQMAADAGHVHLRQLAALKKEVESQVLPPEFSAFAADLSRLAEALPGIDFGLLKDRGWWARTTGKSVADGTKFADQFAKVEQVADGLADRAQALHKTQQAQATEIERILLEIKMECKAIDQIIDQGARWLQDMRSQLKTRLAAATDSQIEQGIKDDNARCEILVDRLKALRATATAAHHSRQLLKASSAKRQAVADFLQEALASDLRGWQRRLSELAAGARAKDASGFDVDGAMATHRELQLSAKKAISECAMALHQEKTMVESLTALEAQD
ncbi:MAG: hypothetical protein ABIR26_13365 [Ramlibacter sp.]